MRKFGKRLFKESTAVKNIEGWIRDSLTEQGDGIECFDVEELPNGRYSVTFYDQDMAGTDYYTPRISFDGSLEDLGKRLGKAYNDYDVETEAELDVEYAERTNAELDMEDSLEYAEYTKELLKKLWLWFYYGRKTNESRRRPGRILREGKREKSPYYLDDRSPRGRMLKEAYNGPFSEDDIEAIAQDFIDDDNPDPSREEVFDVIRHSQYFAPEFEYVQDEFGEDSPELEGLFDEVNEVVDMVMNELERRRSSNDVRESLRLRRGRMLREGNRYDRMLDEPLKKMYAAVFMEMHNEGRPFMLVSSKEEDALHDLKILKEIENMTETLLNEFDQKEANEWLTDKFHEMKGKLRRVPMESGQSIDDILRAEFFKWFSKPVYVVNSREPYVLSYVP